jgi:hypothetical protein
VVDRLATIEKQVDHVILGGAWYQVTPERMAENLWAIMETFGAR